MLFLSNFINASLRSLADRWLGSACLLCGTSVSWSSFLCSGCFSDFPDLGRSCSLCSNPIACFPEPLDLSGKGVSEADYFPLVTALPETEKDRVEICGEMENTVCGYCQSYGRSFDKCIVACRYAPPVTFMLHEFKYRQRLAYVHPFSHQLLGHLQRYYGDDSWPELILPVPLHTKKLKARGYNQAFLIARQLSKKTGIPINSKLIIRRKETLSQMELSLKDRRINMRRAFSIKKHSQMPKHVAIVDDIITSGETVNSMALSLRKQGVECIDVWCIARTAFFA